MVSFCWGGGGGKEGLGTQHLKCVQKVGGWGGHFFLGLSYGLRCLGSASESGLA